MTVRPSRPRRRNRSMRATRCTGSAPFSGSSSTSTRGFGHERGGDLRPLAHALAEPVDATVGDVEQADGRQGGVRRAAIGDPAQVGAVAHELARREPGRHGLVLGHERQVAGARRGRGAGRGRRRRTRPWLTPIVPVIARISVVLPAPLGPSSPVTPGPNEQLSSDSATLAPNHTETSSTSTVGVGGERRVVGRRRPVRSASAASSLDPPVAPQQHGRRRWRGSRRTARRRAGRRPPRRRAGWSGRCGRGTRGRAGTAAGRAR